MSGREKLGKIPDGGGWRTHGRANSHPVIGYHYLHSALDDYSRLTYFELLPNELGDTAAAFRQRAQTWVASHGITTATVVALAGAPEVCVSADRNGRLRGGSKGAFGLPGIPKYGRLTDAEALLYRLIPVAAEATRI